MVKILNKAMTRARWIARMVRMNYIRYNQEFKPRSIVKLREYHCDVEVVNLHPEFTSTLDLHPTFIENCSSYAKPPLTVEFPGRFVATITNGRIFAYDSNNFAVITQDNKMIDDVSFQWVDSPVGAAENLIFKAKGFNKPRKYSGTVFSLLTMGAAKDYYFHWMFDAMTKLELLKESGLFNTVDYFLVPNYKYQFNKEYLKQFNIPESKVIDGSIEDHVQADKLIVCPEVRLDEHLPKWACDFFYNSFVRFKEKKRSGRSIYIARGDSAKNRKVLNEAQLIEVLKTQGFEILYLTKVSVLEQVEIFNSADLIVAVHGGGLSNLVFCEPGTTVLEIFPDQYVRHYFYDICVKRGLDYHYLLCESEKPCNDILQGLLVNLTVDIKAIQKKINLLTTRRRNVSKHTENVAEDDSITPETVTWSMRQTG